MAETKTNPSTTPGGSSADGGMQLQVRPCPKDCRRCSMPQQIYCASMLSFQSFEVMDAIIQRLDRQSQRLDGFEEKLAAIQSSEAELAAPEPVQRDLFSMED